MKKHPPILAIALLSSCAVTVPEMTDADYVIPDDYPANTVSQAEADAYQSVLDDAARSGLPGISMIIDNPDGFWAGAAGLIDIPNRIKAKKNSLYKIASVTKTFTAAIILSMEADGLLSLDDLMAKYLPVGVVSRIANGDRITILQLLSHRSGIINYFPRRIPS